MRPDSGVTHVVDDPLDEVVLALQRRVQQQRQRVELDPDAVVDHLRAGFTEDRLLTLREGEGGNKVYFNNTGEVTL